MPRTINWHLSIGLANADREGEVEVHDDATEDEVYEAVKEAVFDYIEWSFVDTPPLKDTKPLEDE